MAKPSVGIYGIQDCYPDGTIAYAHDHSIAIMEGGQISDYVQLERLTRIKHDNSMHHHLLDLLKEKGLTQKDYDLVYVDNVLGRSFISHNGKLRLEAAQNSELLPTPEKAFFWNIDHSDDAWIVNHELAHVCSCLPFYGQFNNNSLLIHYDGGASQSNFSAWLFKDGVIHPIEHHWELKKTASIYNANALVFKLMDADFHTQHGVPGKFMGYAAFGNHSVELEDWLIKNDYFQSIWNKPALFLKAAKSDFGIVLKHFDLKNTFLQNVAASLQQIWINALLQKISSLNTSHQCSSLYYTGGSALNIVGNNALVKSGMFKNVYVPPCTEDSGLAIGAAALLEGQKGQKIKRHTPYLNSWRLSDTCQDISMKDVLQTANMIADGNVIGICNGYGEAGPRSLGNRSILARADSVELAQKISMQMKKREWFRPIAPLMLKDQFFYFTGETPHVLNSYMLLENTILAKHREEMAGTVHVDGSARIQIISSEDENPWVFNLLKCLLEKFNIRSVINTSFNIQGEPMIHSAFDAINAAKNMKLDALVLNGILQKIS